MGVVERIICTSCICYATGVLLQLLQMSVSQDCCIQVSDAAKVRLSGYGVELAIKSTEYKAKDDTVITGNTCLLVLR